MKILNNCQQQTFTKAYIDTHSLKNNSHNKPIIEALKDENTPLNKFIKEVINTKEFENNNGDCFIRFSEKMIPLDGAAVPVDIVEFSFAKKIEQARKELFQKTEQEPDDIMKFVMKRLIPSLAEKAGTFTKMFDDGSNIYDFDYDSDIPTHKELADYIKSDKIVEDLKEFIQE